MRTYKHYYIFVTIIASFVATTIIITKMISNDAKRTIESALSTVLETSHYALQTWIVEHEKAVAAWAANKSLIRITKKLIAVEEKPDQLLDIPAQKEARELLGDVFKAKDFRGFFIISRNYINLASSRNSNVGLKNLLFDRKSFFEKIWKGIPATSLPIKSDVPLKNSEGIMEHHIPTMFAGAPIVDPRNGEVVGALTFRMDPLSVFSNLLIEGRLGQTGETYAFNKNGRFVSKSRYEKELSRSGILLEGQSSILNLKIQDPGINLLKNQSLEIGKEERDLTFMATYATKGLSGVNLEGYRDYKGVKVVGAWVWNDRFNFGLTTEQDFKEAYSSYHTIIFLVWMLMIFNTVLTSALFLGYKFSQKKVFNERISTFNSVVVSLNHEINNPLTIIKAYLKTIENWKDDQKEFVASVTTMNNSLERIERIIKRISNLDKVDFSKYSSDQKTQMLNLDTKPSN